MTASPLPTAISTAAYEITIAAAGLAVTDRLAAAEARHVALLDAIDLEAARLRALVATERARLARLSRSPR
jgi:hypothetical protein